MAVGATAGSIIAAIITVQMPTKATRPSPIVADMVPMRAAKATVTAQAPAAMVTMSQVWRLPDRADGLSATSVIPPK
ncbi:MAG: hypothetical protein NVSMB12_17460 [Acidimicrobiales bacterium]